MSKVYTNDLQESQAMRKQGFYLCKNTADQCFFFFSLASTIPHLLISKISSFLPAASVTVQAVCVVPGWISLKPVFSSHGSNDNDNKVL